MKQLLESLEQELLHNDGHGRTMVAVDGRYDAGQRAFADALAESLMLRGRKVFHAHIDDFFHPRSMREHVGQQDGKTYFRDAYDYSLFRRVLVDPFHTAGSTGFVLTGFDEVRDQPIFQPKWMSAGLDAILIVDGVFLHRPELAGLWNYSIWLTTPEAASDDPDAARYRAADDAYLAKTTPADSANAIIDNADPENPQRVFSDSC